MREVYLMCVIRYYHGWEPGGITFLAALSPMRYRDNNIKVSFKHILETENTPRQVLDKLEKIIFDTTGEKPSVRDILQGTLDDEKPEYQNWTRQVGYLAETIKEDLPKIDKKTKENTTTKNDKFLEIYNMFVESASAKKME